MAAERNERGLALVSVLWGIAILSLIASAVLTAAVLSAQLTRNSATSDEASAVADPQATAAVLVASLTYFPILRGLIGRTPGDVDPRRYLDAWVDHAVATLAAPTTTGKA